jgi:Tfp pilus assembly protein PilX
MRSTIHSFPYQSGIALVVSLIFLLLLTLISVSAMRVSGLEEKMVSNDRDRNLAFQAAEAALRAGEAQIVAMWRDEILNPPGANAHGADGAGSIQQFCNGTSQAVIDLTKIHGAFHAIDSADPNQINSLVSDCAPCTNACPPPDEMDAATWADNVNNTKSVKVDTADTTLDSQPRYFITYLYHLPPQAVGDSHIYKFSVTARGVGKSDKSVVMLRSYFGGATGFFGD